MHTCLLHPQFDYSNQLGQAFMMSGQRALSTCMHVRGLPCHILSVRSFQLGFCSWGGGENWPRSLMHLPLVFRQEM